MPSDVVNNFFFIVGAQRSGTTYLYHVLEEHPQIEMARPVRPEPKFFLIDALFERGLDDYRSRYFQGKIGARVRGEKSTSYMESEKAAQRIACAFPDAKVLFVLRDPIERAISNYWFTFNNGLETLPLEEALQRDRTHLPNSATDRISVSPFAYLERGRYADFISVYERYFPAQSIKIVLFEQLVGSRQQVHGLYRFLKVDPKFEPLALKQVVNASQRDHTEISPKLAKDLMAYFADSNSSLKEHFGLDLSYWRCG